MFVLLALFFGLGFVLFGVGAGGVGVGDVFRNAGGASGAPSVGDARDRIEKNPKDAEAHRDLATALQVEGDTAEAIVALEDYVELRPRDEGAYRELAGLYLSRANNLQQQAQLAQLEASWVTGGSLFSATLETDQGVTVGDDAIVDAVQTQANERITDLYTRAGQAYASAQDAYERLVSVVPDDPNVRLELAQTAQQGGDLETAIASYEKFLELAPDHPSASIVREQLKQLKQSAQPAPAATG